MVSEKDDNNIFRKLKNQGKLVQSREPWYKRFSMRKSTLRGAMVEKNEAKRKGPAPQPSKRRHAITLAAATVILAVVLYCNATSLIRRSAPTYDPTIELNQRLDALFTAFNTHDVVTTEKIQSDLRKMVIRGAIDDETLNYINSLIESAKYGDWILASDRLYQFILN